MRNRIGLRNSVVSVMLALAVGFASRGAVADEAAAQPTKPDPAKSQPSKPTEPAKPEAKKPEAAKPAETKPADPKPSESKPAAPNGQSAADQIMKDLEKAAAGREAAGNGAQPGGNGNGNGGAGAAERGTTRLMREGSFITSRRGRVTKTSTGELLFAFDGDANGRIDAPVVLMPCLNLMAMERLIEKGGDAVSFSLSGQVFVYKGRNHVLPTLFIVNRKNEMAPGG